jgi:histidinol phosphatase-like PHP family hydrolase
MEPVEPGTNLAAVSSTNVDILAHPGLITLEEASIAAKNGIFLEISGRKGHGLANGHVARVAKQSGAEIILDSDAHEPEDLMTREYAEKVALGAGLAFEEMQHTLQESPQMLLNQISKKSL